MITLPAASHTADEKSRAWCGLYLVLPSLRLLGSSLCLVLLFFASFVVAATNLFVLLPILHLTFPPAVVPEPTPCAAKFASWRPADVAFVLRRRLGHRFLGRRWWVVSMVVEVVVGSLLRLSPPSLPPSRISTQKQLQNSGKSTVVLCQSVISEGIKPPLSLLIKPNPKAKCWKGLKGERAVTDHRFEQMVTHSWNSRNLDHIPPTSTSPKFLYTARLGGGRGLWAAEGSHLEA